MVNHDSNLGAVGMCALVFAALLPTLGCLHRPTRVRPPKIDAGQAGRKAVDLYDEDADGQLSTSELSACPGILRRIETYDADADGLVTGDEIADRIREWQKTKVGLLNISCRITMGGKPLSGAEVTLEPEPFLGEAVEAASGTTDAYGMVLPTIPSERLPEDQKDLQGIYLGIYKVRVTHPTRTLPAKFNSETTLGCEVDHLDQWNGIVIELTP